MSRKLMVSESIDEATDIERLEELTRVLMEVPILTDGGWLEAQPSRR